MPDSYEDFDVADVMYAFQLLLNNPDIAKRMQAEGRKGGGYLCITDQNAVPLVIMLVGEPDSEKLSKYLDFSQEKAGRLATHPEHGLSRQSRNPDAGQWGGAVRGDDFIFSFSGLPEHLDELYCLLLAVGEGQLLEDEAVELLKMLPNDFSEQFHNLVLDLLKF